MHPYKTLSIIALTILSLQGLSQKVVFLHHSVGDNVFYDGNVPEWITEYNVQQGKAYEVDEKTFPNDPYPWDNYPYDYWKLWINGACDNKDADIPCLDTLCSGYDIIIFKHCYPGAGILPDSPTPSVSSSKKTLANYKLQYRALRDLLDSYPDNKFILWTLAPQHRLTTDSAEAARAREFVRWVKEGWLTEDGREHPNIYIFDFFGLVAELDTTPENGTLNCLKYEFEIRHDDDNSHPNQAANEYAGPLFAQFIVDVIEDIEEIQVSGIVVNAESGAGTITSPGGTLQLSAAVTPENATQSGVVWSVVNGTGQAEISENGLLTALADGTVIVNATATDGSGVTGSLEVTITGQTVLVTGVTVTAAGGIAEISHPGNTLQLFAEVVPVNATNTSVGWSLENGTGEADIDENGWVTAHAEGTVTAMASALDGSGITGILPLEIGPALPTGIQEDSEDIVDIRQSRTGVEIRLNPGSGYQRLRVFNLMGSPVLSEQLHETVHTVNMSALPSGLYLWVLTGDRGVQVSKASWVVKH